MPSYPKTTETQNLPGFPLAHMIAVAAGLLLLLLLFVFSRGGDDDTAQLADQPQAPDYQVLLESDDTDIQAHWHPANRHWTVLSELPPPAIPYRPLFAGRIAAVQPPYAPQGQGVGRVRYDIKPGDTLTDIFAQHSLGHRVVYQLLAADEDLLALDILRPGHHLVFKKSLDSGQLQEMKLFIHAGQQVIYRRVADDLFEAQEVVVPGEWRQQSVAGQVQGSFYMSGISAGLSEGEIVQVGKLLGERLDFRRQLRAGDHFQVIRTSQYVDDKPTGQSHLVGFRIEQRGRSFTGFLHDDGMYYDEDGESLTRAFRRHPYDGNYRLSSHFNPRRRHPVTGRVSPHNGTDFAMPIGTPVVSIGDGVVTRVENHPFAGKYIEIQHGPTYKTRYLHLHRHLVRRGQSVKRGERIGLSGNTGRTTGPHLHFEVHVNNRPVNPMRVDLPMVASISSKDKAAFKEHVEELVAMMDSQKQQHLAMAKTGNGRS